MSGLPVAPSLGACPACGRRYVIVPGAEEPPCCACGAELDPVTLPPGVHELRRARSAAAHHAPAGSSTQEADLGYGESHGYGPAHGGPTGPGDAPATDAPAADAPAADAPAAEPGAPAGESSRRA